MSRFRRLPTLPDLPDLAVGLLPVAMAVAFLRGRAQKVRQTEDLGALSFELVMLAVGLIAVAAAVCAVIIAAIKGKAGSLK